MQKKQRYKDANTTGNHDILGTCAACWYEQDGLGGVQRLINRCGGVRSSYAYTAWGIPLNWRETIPNRYTFTSREYNAESGDYYYRARHYTPTLGRFTTRDPVGFDTPFSLYTYVGNNPITNTDPHGLFLCKHTCKKGDKRKLTDIEIWLIPIGKRFEDVRWAKSLITFLGKFSIEKILMIYFGVINLAQCRTQGTHVYTVFIYEECECVSCWLLWQRWRWVEKEHVHKYVGETLIPGFPGSMQFERAKKRSTGEAAFKAHLKALGWDKTNTENTDKFKKKLPQIYPIKIPEEK